MATNSETRSQALGGCCEKLMLAALATLVLYACPAAGAAAATGPLGAVLIDLQQNRVLHADNANRQLAPASLTKLMSALVLLDALQRAEVPQDAVFTVSAKAAGQPPSRIGLREGQTIDVEAALAAMIVASGNDAAVVVAEGVAGSESEFVARMNDMARRTGLTRSLFTNASGLPSAKQRTTARDMALLASTLYQRFPERAALFARRSVEIDGRRQGTTNSFLSSYRGAAGMKTGFTCRAGFNLVAAVRRDHRQLLGVVMGSPTPSLRDATMRRLMDQGFDSAAHTSHSGTLEQLLERPGQGVSLAMPTKTVALSCLLPGYAKRGPSGWTIDVGVKRSEKEARQLARQFIARRRGKLATARAIVIPRFTGVNLFRAGVTGLSKENARDVCLEFRKRGGDCVILDTSHAKAQLAHAERVRALSKKVGAGLKR